MELEYSTMTDTLSLVLRRYGHGADSHDRDLAMLREGDRRERDVADDGTAVLGDPGDDRARIRAQHVDDVRLRGGFEGGAVNLANRSPVARSLRADQHDSRPTCSVALEGTAARGPRRPRGARARHPPATSQARVLRMYTRSYPSSVRRSVSS
jgi:hypothetical protein